MITMQELLHGHLEPERDMLGDKGSGLILEGKFYFKNSIHSIPGTVIPRNLLVLGPSKIVPQIAKSADWECYCM